MKRVARNFFFGLSLYFHTRPITSFGQSNSAKLFMHSILISFYNSAVTIQIIDRNNNNKKIIFKILINFRRKENDSSLSKSGCSIVSNFHRKNRFRAKCNKSEGLETNSFCAIIRLLLHRKRTNILHWKIGYPKKTSASFPSLLFTLSFLLLIFTYLIPNDL